MAGKQPTVADEVATGGPAEKTSRVFCSRTGKPFGLVWNRVSGNDWIVRHSYAINPNYTTSQLDEGSISGRLSIGDSYSGCRFCRGAAIVRCGACGTMLCNQDNNERVQCVACGAQLRVEGDLRRVNTRSD